MSISLKKGAKVSLAKASQELGISNLKHVAVGLGWDCNDSGGHAFDSLQAFFPAIRTTRLCYPQNSFETRQSIYRFLYQCPCHRF